MAGFSCVIAAVSARRSAMVRRRERRSSALIVVVVIRAPQWHMLGLHSPPVALTLTRTCGFDAAEADPTLQAARTAKARRRSWAR